MEEKSSKSKHLKNKDSQFANIFVLYFFHCLYTFLCSLLDVFVAFTIIKIMKQQLLFNVVKFKKFRLKEDAISNVVGVVLGGQKLTQLFKL